MRPFRMADIAGVLREECYLLKLYLDACCYNRPLDAQNQPRIRYESEAILALLWRVWFGHYIIMGSDALLFELRKPLSALMFYSVVRDIVHYDVVVWKRAAEIRGGTNIKDMDSVHLASAGVGGADIFLTTDDRLMKACAHISLPYRVLNPITFMVEEVLRDDYR